MFKIDKLKTCRTCLKDGKIMIPVKDTLKGYEPFTIMDLLQMSSFVNVAGDDNFPQKVCDVCCKKIKTLYQFKSVCQKSEEIISKFLEEHFQSQTIYDMKIDPSDISDGTEYEIFINSNFQYPSGSGEDNSGHEDFKQEANMSFEENEIKPYIDDMYQDNSNTEEERSFIIEDNSDTESITIIEDFQGSGDNRQLKADKHMINNVMKIVCFACKSEFKDEKSFFDHVILEHGDRYIFESKEYTPNCVFRRRVYYCKKCKLFTRNRMKYINHKISHEKDSHECVECNEVFSNKKLYNSHKKECYQKKLICHFCKIKYSNESEYDSHMVTHKRNKGDPHLCPTCGKTFNDPTNYNVHLRIHTGEKPYVCDKCDKTFAQWSTFQLHKTIHTEERKFICSDCGKGYKNEQALRRHSVIHSGEKKVKCPICDSRFYDRRAMKKHYVVHSDNKEHICHICNKEFKHKRNLTVHIQYHTGEKRHVCSICNEGFVQRVCLKSHMKKNHPSEKLS